MASGTDTTSVSGNAGQAALDRFAGMMIERMRQMKDTGWKQGWIGGASGFAGLPQNVSGRNYSGSNSFFLQLQTAAMGYRLPVYLTFKQAHNLKAHVLKGEKAFPVVYWDMMVKDKYGKRISSEEYRALGKEEKKGMEVIPFIKAFPVYNVQQTNLAEIQPERMQKLQDKFKVPELRDTAGMYAHSALDRMVETQAWLCPIQVDKRVDGGLLLSLQRPHCAAHEGAVQHRRHAGGHLPWRHGVLFHHAARDDALDHDGGTSQPGHGRQVRRPEVCEGGTGGGADRSDDQPLDGL